MTETDVLAAQYDPGFSDVLTYWRVFLQTNRWLRQEVVVYDHASEYHNQVLRFRARLSRTQVRELWEIVERIGFRDFDRAYTHRNISVTDRPTYRITVRFRDRIKEVEAYDLPGLAGGERQPDMVGFAELWEAITRHAPYGKVPLSEGVPRPWWRFW
jgi:hypothetical protein